MHNFFLKLSLGAGDALYFEIYTVFSEPQIR